MRLTDEQQRQIQRIVQAQLGNTVVVSVFGSRIDDAKRGGDLDLLIESKDPVPLLRRAALKIELESALKLPVDLVITERGKALSSFQALAKARARRLPEAS